MTAPAAVEVYVAPSGNAFMTDIAGWVVEAVRLTGRDARLVADGSLPGDVDRGHATASVVVAPHEFYELSDRPLGARRAAARRSIPIATEQPGTPWFDRSIEWCALAPWTLDINRAAVDAALAAGLDARLFRLGAVPSMDRRTGADRTVDVTVLAGLTDHRARRLASLAGTLWPHRSQLRLFPTDRPVGATAATGSGPLFGRAKYDLLANSRILLNLHRDENTTYFEWARVVEAMANGCVVVTEASDSVWPLEDGQHLVVTDDPASAIDDLLAEPDRLRSIGETAADLVHGELALAESVAPLLDDIEAGLAGASAPHAARVRRTVPWSRVGTATALRRPRPAFRPFTDLRRRALAAVVAERRLRRDVDALRCAAVHGSDLHTEIVDSPGWATATPTASAIVTLFDYADLVAGALDSLAASVDVDLEIVVVDDHSTDSGRQVVTEWIEGHPDLPVRLVGRDANGGLAAARNLAIEHTRTERVMVLDADNRVYPTCVRRLTDALDGDTAAAFAWSILEVFGDESGLLSATAWDPDRLLERNQIDAQVMLRRSAWADLGGYRELPGLLLGWEDWDLWLRIVETGGHGVLVPEMLGRYRSQGDSMVSGPNRFNDVMLERFEAAHPDLDFPAR